MPRLVGWLLALILLAVGAFVLLIADVLKDDVKNTIEKVDLGLPRGVDFILALAVLAVIGLVVPYLGGLANQLLRGQISEGGAVAGADTLVRTQLLTRLRHAYSSALNQLLVEQVSVQPHLDAVPGAVVGPLDDSLSIRPKEQAALPGATLASVYEDGGGTAGDGLLILGDAGTGKTTGLLQLALDVATRSPETPEQPVPVYATLSSWHVRHDGVSSWLAEQLRERYGLARSVSQQWLAEGTLIPFLDGLDEVRDATDRAACVAALNQFRQDHPLALVVTCRSADYQSLGEQLRLGSAVVIRRLDRSVVLDHLRDGGPALASLFEAAESDADLLELLRAPLLLGMAVISYQGEAVELSAPSVSDARRALLNAYVAQRFELVEKKRQGGSYARERTMSWLAFVAKNLNRLSESVFFVEHLQPDWLRSPGVTRTVRYAPVAFATAVVGGGTAIAFLFVGGIGAMVFMGLVVGVGAWGISFAMFGRPELEDESGLLIEPAEQFRWSWPEARQSAVFVACFVAFALCVAVPVMWIEEGWLAAILLLLLSEVAIVTPVAISSGLVSIPVSTRVTPNQGIRLSARNGIRVALSTAVAVGVPIGLLIAVVANLLAGVIAGAIIGG